MKGKMKVNGLQQALEEFIDSQVLIPGKWRPVNAQERKLNSLESKLLLKFQKNLEMHKESI
jgi:hypothetical protein